MRVALLSDIHGNDQALDAVLAAVRGEHIDLLMICGDFVGYYFAPDRVMEMLRPWKKHMIRGNHEDMLARTRGNPVELERLRKVYGSGLGLALERLCPSDLDELTSLPTTASIEVEGRRIFLCHGAPWDTDTYVYPDAKKDLLNRCIVPEHDFVVMGHTHYPMVRDVGSVRLVNPGSVGQPRNRRPGASWAILDTGTREVSLRHEIYDATAICEEAKSRDPGIPYLHNVLVRI
jgi:putative phosphoesterase